MSKSSIYRTILNQRKGQKLQIEQSLFTAEESLKKAKKLLRYHEQAKSVIKEVGLKTQQQLQFHISDIATMALTAVLDNPYQLIAEFIERRDKTECDLFFTKGEEKLDPLTEAGGGAVDIATFALRIGSWSMQRPHSRNTIVLDEPMKNLSPEYKERGSEMIKMVSEKLNIQFIIVNHEVALTANADKVFKIYKKNKISKIE